jgi:long-chain acyl-CoA synthetase
MRAGAECGQPKSFTGIGKRSRSVESRGERRSRADVYQDPARQVAVLIYTTGTTGRPKGVMLSHRNLALRRGPGQKDRYTLFPDDVTLCVMPISHSYGLTLHAGHAVRQARTCGSCPGSRSRRPSTPS